MNAPVQSHLFCRPDGALAILHWQPTFGRPYRDFGILALPSFNMSATRSTSGCNVAAETSNHLRAGEPAATRRVALRSRIPTGFRPRAQGCAAVAPKRRYGAPRRRKARATLGHRPSNIPNRNAVAAHPFPPARLTSATTPLALIRFPNAHPRLALHANLGLEAAIPLGLFGARVCDVGIPRYSAARRSRNQIVLVLVLDCPFPITTTTTKTRDSRRRRQFGPIPLVEITCVGDTTIEDQRC